MLKNKKQKMLYILKTFEKTNPNPKCELFYLTPFQLVVSVVLSAQATDKIVNECMKNIYLQGFEPEDVIKLGIKGLEKLIQKIGLYKNKAKYVYNIAKTLIEKYDKKIPNDRSILESFLGVGRKSANVILGELYQKPVLAVDTHVFRVTKRLGFHNESTPLKAEAVLLNLIPQNYLPRAHHWFVLHGRYVCKAIKPNCPNCELQQFCDYYLKKFSFK